MLGETQHERANNIQFRNFSLGGLRILEKERYDRLGIVSTVNDEDTLRVGNIISKARRVLNATTGIGIRNKGLNMNTCNLILWSIVVPTALFGCDIWCLTANDIAEIEGFQVAKIASKNA